jgi:Holliday junction resolvase RusA-like endonuclease
MISFEVPGEPQGKGRAKIVKIGGFSRMATPAKTVSYEGLIAHAAAQVMAGAPPLTGPVWLSVEMYFGVPASWSKKKREQALLSLIKPTKKPDADNVIKAVCDGLNGVVWVDDVQVVSGSWKKRYSDRPRVSVAVMVDDQPFLSLPTKRLSALIDDVAERVKQMQENAAS